MNGEYNIEPSTLTGKLLLQGIRALEDSNGRLLNAKYPNTPEGLEEFKQKSIAYLRSVMLECEDTDLQNTPYPNVESWCAYLNISRMTLHNYSARSEAWADAIREVKTVIVSAKSQLADHGKIPPMTWVFDATNNFEYFNTSEYKLVEETPKEQRALTAAELPKLGNFAKENRELLPRFGGNAGENE